MRASPGGLMPLINSDYNKENEMLIENIKDLLKPFQEYGPSRSLRSDNCMLVSIPDFNMVHYGRQTFNHAAASLWNNIQVEIQIRLILNQNSKTISKLICLRFTETDQHFVNTRG